MSGEKFSQQNKQLNCPECGHELDLPPPPEQPGDGMTLGIENTTLAPDEVVVGEHEVTLGEHVTISPELYARLMNEARDLASGEDNPRLRAGIYEAALRWLVERERRTRIAAALAHTATSNG